MQLELGGKSDIVLLEVAAARSLPMMVKSCRLILTPPISRRIERPMTFCFLADGRVGMDRVVLCRPLTGRSLRENIRQKEPRAIYSISQGIQRPRRCFSTGRSVTLTVALKRIIPLVIIPLVALWLTQPEGAHVIHTTPCSNTNVQRVRLHVTLLLRLPQNFHRHRLSATTQYQHARNLVQRTRRSLGVPQTEVQLRTRCGRRRCREPRFGSCRKKFRVDFHGECRSILVGVNEDGERRERGE